MEIYRSITSMDDLAKLCWHASRFGVYNADDIFVVSTLRW